MKLIIGAKQLQRFLQMKGAYKGKIDGIFGPASQGAAEALVLDYMERNHLDAWDKHGHKVPWRPERFALAATQILFKELGFYHDNVDGLRGPNTAYALEQWQNAMRDQDDEEDKPNSPFPTYGRMEAFYGPVGQNIKRWKLPYKMRLAWDTDEVVSKISLHAKCGKSAIGVLEAARDHYGGAKAMAELRLDLFGGSLNVRKMRGGSRWSTHSWAAAIDIDPSHNQFRWTDAQATLDAEVYDQWWKLWEKAGWVSLGRERNYDWMHIQAVRL